MQRAARARLLARRYPASREILLFSAALAEWQGAIAAERQRPDELLGGLVDLVVGAGPEVLRTAARKLAHLPHLHDAPPLDFFARAARQPVAEASRPADIEAPEGLTRCSWCRRSPIAGCLKKQGDAQSLLLVCSLCFGRWSFPRARCPACGQEAEGRLVYYTAAEFPQLRLQACEACRAYLQFVDLDQDPEAIPEVDELAGLPLDLWACEQGYHKLVRNLAGI